MKEQEAIICLKADKEYLTDMKICDGEEMDMAINALEKQIPQKISIEGYCGFVDYICPVCGNDIDLNKKYNYCSNCGQRLEQ